MGPWQWRQSNMKNLRTLFAAMRAAGLIAIAALFLYVEWRFIHGNLANALNLLIQVFVIASTLLLPLFWLLLGVTLIGHFGKRRIEKRVEQSLVDG